MAGGGMNDGNMSDGVTALLHEAGIPVTRENYIELNWGEPLPQWTSELEAELPDELQDWSLFEVKDGKLSPTKAGAKAKGFDPNEPRDESGKWTDGGGDGGSGETSPEGTSENFDPKVIQVGGDAWNQATARRLERDYQKAKPALSKIVDNAVADSGLTDQLNPPKDFVSYWDTLSTEQQDAVYARWKEENADKYPTDIAAAEHWDGLTDEEKAKITNDQILVDMQLAKEQQNNEEDEDAPVYADSWDTMSEAKQDQAKASWKENNHSSYYDSEVENWSTEQAPDEARTSVASDFNDGKETEWASDALVALREDREEKGQEDIPFDDDTLIEALKLDYDYPGYGGGSYWKKHADDIVEFDDDVLRASKASQDAGQGTFAGTEPPDHAKLLTDDMRADIVQYMIDAMDERADKVAGDMSPPDYLSESVDEYLESAWDEMSDLQKYTYADENDIIEKPDESKSPSVPDDPLRVDALPDQYDPLNETSGADYRRTQRLARYLSITRARQLIVERGLSKTYPDKARVAAMDGYLWNAWKGSSTSSAGQLLQVATAEELGGRLNTQTAQSIDADKLRSYANDRWPDLGGYKGMLAYVRAKWETTQYLLDKAGESELELYRGLDLGRHDMSKYNAAMQEKHARGKQMVDVSVPSGGSVKFTKLPTVKVDRNGAASMTTDIGIANNWAQGGNAKITLRAVVPRTAAISVPAYGINVQGEHEVVVAGVAWKSWDAWSGKAPPIGKFPIGGHGTGIGTSAPVQQAA
jgi:hypothetical protein